MLYSILSTIAFYLIAFLIIFVLTKISPNAHDGGPGLGGIALMVLPLISLVLAGLNCYWGFKIEQYYFINAGIHSLVLIIMVKRLFI